MVYALFCLDNLDKILIGIYSDPEDAHRECDLLWEQCQIAFVRKVKLL
jgi:hypothetical protein